MDSKTVRSGSEIQREDQKRNATGGWLERLPQNIIQGILSSRNNSQKAESWNLLKTLPPDIIQEIIIRLPLASVVHCSLLCRPFHKVATSQNFALAHVKHGYDNSPFLIFHNKDGPLEAYPSYLSRLNFGYLDGSECRVKRIDIPFKGVMRKYSIIGSSHGYLCLFEESRDVPLSNNRGLIYNPLTAYFKELPRPSQVFGSLFAYGFGFHAGTGEYKVLMAGNQGEQRGVQILTIGAIGWKYLQTPSCWFDEDGAAFVFKKRGLWVNNSLHWLTSRKFLMNGAQRPRVGQQIIVFDLAAEEFRQIAPPNGISDLLVVRGNLSAVNDCNEHSWEIWVMKDYGVQSSWSREFIIGLYIPAALQLHGSISDNRPMDVQVVCCLKNGKFLMQYGHQAWCCYDPETEMYEDLIIHGLPRSLR